MAYQQYRALSREGKLRNAEMKEVSFQFDLEHNNNLTILTSSILKKLKTIKTFNISLPSTPKIECKMGNKPPCQKE